ncbi:MAG: ATP synthase F0 subunit B [Proteobacteria bacterium]|nr:ATP synthase F0 subunit B [Pseudomonadota bacterium]
MVSVDVSLILQIINFIILIFVLNLVLYKPIRNILSQRKEKIEGFERDIDTCIENAKEKEDAFSQGVKNARAQGLKQKEVFLAEAAEEEHRMIDEIHRKGQSELTRIREKIVHDTEAVRVSLKKEVDDFAKAIGHKILGREI